MKIRFAGSGAFGLPTLRALADRHEIVQVLTQPDKPAGRGKRLTATPIGAWCDTHGLPVTRTMSINSEPMVESDVLVVIAFGQKVGQHVTDAPEFGAVNLHASLLPRWRGAAPIHHAVMAGDAVTGNSIIRLAERMDAGAVLGQSQRPIDDTYTTGDLHDLLAEDGVELMLDVLDELESGTAEEIEQDETLATPAGKLSRADAILDFTADAKTVSRKINGLSPWPGVRVTVNDEPVTLLRSRPADDDGTPGTILDNGHIACGVGSIEVLELQPSGKKSMPLSAYRNGREWSGTIG
ncbi:MAG: methionyl-tRNA formyltransferase [Planctomycetota bacterium]